MNIPNALMARVPGFEKLATTMMKKTLDKKGVASIEKLLNHVKDMRYHAQLVGL